MEHTQAALVLLTPDTGESIQHDIGAKSLKRPNFNDREDAYEDADE